MTTCNQCGGQMTVGPSTFPGWNLLACEDCGRPIRLISQTGPRMAGIKLTKTDTNRAMRAARRRKLGLSGKEGHS